MQSNAILIMLSVSWLGALLTACSDQATPPTALQDVTATPLVTADAVAVEPLPEPFTRRAPLDPFFINQPSEMMIRSTSKADIAIQRLVTQPTDGFWHTHPGPSFGIVESGYVTITKYSKKAGCVSTTYGPGQAYFEVADEVHIASVEGGPAVEYKVRFNTPVGEPFATTVPAPRCG